MRIQAFLVAGALVAGACGDDGGSPKGEPDQTGASQPEVMHVDGIEGLSALFRGWVTATRSGDPAEVEAALTELALPEPKAFFTRHFRDDVSLRLIEGYGAKAEHLEEMAQVLRSQIDRGLDRVVVERFETDTDLRAVGYQKLALGQMTEVIPLYSVRLQSSDGKQSFHLWSFVHDGKRFRWVGKLKGVLARVEEDRDALLELRVDQAQEITGD